MQSLDDFRKDNPAYRNVDDASLSDAIYKKYYSDIDRVQFDEQLETASTGTLKRTAIGLGRGFTDLTDAIGQQQRKLDVKEAQTGGLRTVRFGIPDNRTPEIKQQDIQGAQGELEQFNANNVAEKALFDESGIGQTTAASVGRSIGRQAPTIIGSVPASGLNILKAAPVLFGAGSANSFALQNAEVGEGSRESVSLGEAATEGAFNVAGDAAGRVIIKGLGGIVNKLSGSKSIQVLDDAGRLTEESIQMLESLPPEQMQQLVQKGVLTADEGRAFNEFYNTLDKAPTRAQVTQTVDDFRNQQDAVKSSGATNNLIREQEGAIASKTRALGGNVAGVGDNVDAGEELVKPLISRVSAADKAISKTYKDITKKLPNLSFKATELKTQLARYASEDTAADSIITGLRGELSFQESSEGFLRPQTAESVRKYLNARFEGANPNTKRLIKQFKDAIDNDVERAAGVDFFKPARDAKTNLEKTLSRAKIGSRDKNGSSILRDIVEGKVTGEEAFEKLVLRKGKDSVRSLNAYANMMKSGTKAERKAGEEALTVMRKRTAEYIYEQAFKQTGEGGSDVVSAAQFNRLVFEKIGQKRLKTIFGQEGFDGLVKMQKLINQRVPKGDTFKGSGPSAQAIFDLADRSGSPSLSLFKRLLVDGKKAVTSRAKDIDQANPTRQTVAQLQKLTKDSKATEIGKRILLPNAQLTDELIEGG